MVWKSNLDENEQEFIEDFGAKGAPSQNIPAVPQRKAAAKKTAARGMSANKKGASPTRSNMGASVSQMGGDNGAVGGMDMNPSYQPSGDGVGGSGEELAQTLEKVVSQLDIISRTLHVLEQRVSSNESSVQTVMEYFKELREQRLNQNSMNVQNMNMGFTASQGNVINAYAQASRVPPPTGTTMPAGLMSFNQEAAYRGSINHMQSSNANSQIQRMEGQSRGSSNYLPSNQGLARADLGMTETYNQRLVEEGQEVLAETQADLVQTMARSTLRDSERDDGEVVGEDINARE